MKSDILDLPPTQRRWRDLGKRRVFLSLAAAPVPPAVLGLLIVVLVLGDINGDAAGSILAAAIAWSLVLGSAYLLGISRWRGIVGRIECLMLGVAAAATLPLVVVLLSADTFAIDPFASNPSSDAKAIAIVLAIMLTPFGLLGGWIFWRLGVRPTVSTILDVSPVFD